MNETPPPQTNIVTLVLEVDDDYLPDFLDDWGDLRERLIEHAALLEVRIELSSSVKKLELPT